MQQFIVLEITRNSQGNIAVTPSAKETEAAAKKKYHQILVTAADSQAPVHGAVLMNYDGFPLKREFYIHEPEPQPEPEPEPEPELDDDDDE